MHNGEYPYMHFCVNIYIINDYAFVCKKIA